MGKGKPEPEPDSLSISRITTSPLILRPPGSPTIESSHGHSGCPTISLYAEFAILTLSFESDMIAGNASASISSSTFFAFFISRFATTNGGGFGFGSSLMQLTLMVDPIGRIGCGVMTLHELGIFNWSTRSFSSNLTAGLFKSSSTAGGDRGWWVTAGAGIGQERSGRVTTLDFAAGGRTPPWLKPCKDRLRAGEVKVEGEHKPKNGGLCDRFREAAAAEEAELGFGEIAVLPRFLVLVGRAWRWVHMFLMYGLCLIFCGLIGPLSKLLVMGVSGFGAMGRYLDMISSVLDEVEYGFRV